MILFEWFSNIVDRLFFCVMTHTKPTKKRESFSGYWFHDSFSSFNFFIAFLQYGIGCLFHVHFQRSSAISSVTVLVIIFCVVSGLRMLTRAHFGRAFGTHPCGTITIIDLMSYSSLRQLRGLRSSAFSVVTVSLIKIHSVGKCRIIKKLETYEFWDSSSVSSSSKGMLEATSS